MYIPKVGDIAIRTRGTQPVLIVSVLNLRPQTYECVVLYKSHSSAVVPVRSLHPWTDDLNEDDIHDFIRAVQVSDIVAFDPDTRKVLDKALLKYAREIAKRKGTSPQGGATIHPYDETNLEGMDEMKTLYTWTTEDKTVKFGHKLATAKSGDWVMEEKDGTGVVTIAKNLVEEVMPYTVDAVYCGDSGGRTYSFFAKEGDFAVGDVLMHPCYNNMLRIAALDTKSKKADTWMCGLKLAGTKIESGE